MIPEWHVGCGRQVAGGGGGGEGAEGGGRVTSQHARKLGRGQ